MGQYVSLHTHTEGSFLDGYSKTHHLAERAVELGMPAVAITDHGEVALHMEFYHECNKAGVKPILGMEGYIVDSVDRVRKEKDSVNSHLCIWAENDLGRRNLWAWSSLAYMKGRYYKPLADWSLAREYHEGLIVSDGCLLSNMARYILKEDMDSALQWGSQFLEIFGEDNFFMELHTFQIIDPQTDEHLALNEQMKKMNLGKIEIAKQLSVPLVVVNDAHYAWEKDWENHGLVWAMSTNSDQTSHGKAASWIMGDDEVHYWMAKHGVPTEITQSAIENTAKIGERCNVEITPRLHVPKLTLSEDGDLQLYRRLVDEGFQKKVIDKGLDPVVYQARREEEDEQIINKKFYGYFNIVADYCKWAKGEGMLVGPSRGSAGGSLIAYLMDITELDPVKYNLLFGRFIDPGRKSFPDIDLDFPQSRRDEVKAYLRRKYGEENTCGVGTLSRLNPKGILADLCRAMGISWDDKQAMAKIIEQVRDINTANVEITWDQVLVEKGGDLARWAEKYPKLFQKIGEMMGLVRQSSVHAAGVIISDESLLGELPMRLKGSESEGGAELVCQFEHKWVEELGFIKFDVLGIRHLDTMTDAYILANPDVEWTPEIFYNFPDEMYLEPEIWAVPNSGHSLGIFQLEANSMEAVTKDFKPLSHLDVKDLISVNRPGITRTGMLDEYIHRRHGRKQWTVNHPLLTEILSETYGVVVYQEQVMKIVQVLAGYSLAEADKIRKIMGKMLYHEMKEQMPAFIQRCAGNPEFVKGCPAGKVEEVAYECWKQIEAAGIYSFNEAHGMGYALYTTWGVWLKYHYFPQYITALLRTDPEKAQQYLSEARQAGIPVLPPDINISENKFILTPEGEIRYALTQVSQVGDGAVKEYMAKRPFTSLSDCLTRCSGNRGAKTNVVENLISIGAFDNLPVYHDEDGNAVYMDRQDSLWYLWNRRALLDSDFRKNKLPEKKAPDFSKDEVVYDTEVALVGSWITKDPIGKYMDFYRDTCVITEDGIDRKVPNQVFDIGGQLTQVKEHQARNGLMGFLKIELAGEVMEVTCFADKYKESRPFLKAGRPVVARVKKLDKGCQLLEIMRLDLAWAD